MRRLLFVAMLFTSIGEDVFAQYRQDLSYPAKIPAVHKILIEFSNKNQLIVAIQDMNDLVKYRNVDSLMNFLVADFQGIKESLQGSTASRTLIYELKNGKRTMQLYEHLPKFAQYQTSENKEVVQIKTLQDTLVVQQWIPKPSEKSSKVEEKGDWLKFYFMLNNIEDIEPIVKAGINPKIEASLQQVRSYKKFNLFEPKATSYLQLSNNEIHGHTLYTFRGIISAMAGVGVVRGNISTNFTLNFIHLPHLQNSPEGLNLPINHGGLLFNWQPHFFFDKAADGKLQTYRNDFINAGFAFFYPNEAKKSLDDNKSEKLYATLSIGYLVRRRGAYFEPNTFRLASSYRLSSNLYVEPEMYFNKFFKNVSPGVRMVVWF